MDPQQWEALLSFSSSPPVGGLHLSLRSAGGRGPGRTPAMLSSSTLWLDKRPAVTDTHQGLNHGLKGLYVEICSLGEMGRVPPGSKSPAAEHPSLLSLSSQTLLSTRSASLIIGLGRGVSWLTPTIPQCLRPSLVPVWAGWSSRLSPTYNQKALVPLSLCVHCEMELRI